MSLRGRASKGPIPSATRVAPILLVLHIGLPNILLLNEKDSHAQNLKSNDWTYFSHFIYMKQES